MAELPENDLVDLFIDSIMNRLSETGRQKLADWAQTTPARQHFAHEVHDTAIASREMAIYVRIDPREGFARWQRQRRQKKQQIFIRTAVAAAILGTLFLWWQLRSDVQHNSSPPGPVDTLAMKERSIENNTVLSASGNNRPDSVRQLPDGTRVWLNKASKIFYPVKFSGKERMVELDGEGYFEVARDVNRPFVVRVQGMRVVAMGTRFDVMAYSGEDSVRATLIEGMVNVQKDGKKISLKPGQQISATSGPGGVSVPQEVDTSEVIEWKDNVFYFPDHTSLKTVLGRIARWYHLELVYKVRDSDNQECGGDLQANLPLDQVLDHLIPKGITYRISKGQLIVETRESS